MGKMDLTLKRHGVSLYSVNLTYQLEDVMRKQEAYKLGYWSGIASAEYGDFTPDELKDEESFIAACLEICENKRQYADSPTYDLARERNSDSLFDAFDEGESAGILKGWEERQSTLVH